MPNEHDLGPLEMRVLGLLDTNEAATVQDVQQALRRSKHELAYTTVMTVLTRLHEKGLVVREKDGRRYLYRLGMRAPAVSRGIVSRIQRALFPGERTRPILALIDDEHLSADDLRELRRRIDERLKSSSKGDKRR